MTAAEKREALRRYCNEHSTCRECILNGEIVCYTTFDPELIKKNYEKVFPAGRAAELAAEKPASDNVNHPSYYQGKYECIDEMILLFGEEAVKTWARLTVYKYKRRWTGKNGQEDLDKADWYLDKLVELIGCDGK